MSKLYNPATLTEDGLLAKEDKKKVDGVPCLVVHADGTSTIYDTPALAVAGAVSGDTIMVSPGNYTVSTNLAKNGVDWWFAPGATLTWSAAGVGYIFDDATGAKSYTVAGHANFVRSISGVPANQLGDVNTGAGSACGVFRAINPASKVFWQWNKITVNVNEVVTPLGWYTGIYHDGGATVTVDGNEINGDRLSSAVYSYCTAYWWGNGPGRGRIGRIYSPSIYDSVTFIFTGFYTVNLLAGVAGDLEISLHEIDTPYPVNDQSDNAVNALWLKDLARITGIGTTAGGKHYVTSQKLAGAWSAQGGKFYFDFQKAGGGLAAVIGIAPVIEVAGGYANGYVGAFEGGGNGVLEWLRVDDAASEVHLAWRDMPAGSGQNAVWVSAGTCNLYSGKIVTDSGKLDLRRTGGTLNVTASVSYSTAKTSGTITKLNNSDQINEGSTNLFYLDSRARAAISGTSNRITVTSGVVDIAAAYVGQTTITTLGTIATGVWNGTAIASGFIADLSATYSVKAGNTSLVTLGTVTTGTWNATAIAAAYVGDLSATYSVKAGNTSLVTLGTITTGVWNGMAIGAAYIGDLSATYSVKAGNTSLVTLGTVTTGTWNATAIGVAYGGTNLASYTAGDILYASGSTTLAKLGANATATNKFLRSVSSGNPAYAQVDYSDLSGAGSTSITTLGTIATGTWQGTTLGVAYGGTGLTSYTLGDLPYASGATAISKLAGNITTTRKFLRQTGDGAISAAPAWDTLVAADIPAPGTSGQILYSNSGVVGALAGLSFDGSTFNVLFPIASTKSIARGANTLAAATNAIDATQGNTVVISTSADFTVAYPTNGSTGKTLTLEVTNAAGADKVMTFHASYALGGVASTLTLKAGKTHLVPLNYLSIGKWCVAAPADATGYS